MKRGLLAVYYRNLLAIFVDGVSDQLSEARGFHAGPQWHNRAHESLREFGEVH